MQLGEKFSLLKCGSSFKYVFLILIMSMCAPLCGYRHISAEARRLCQVSWSWKLQVVVSYQLQNPVLVLQFTELSALLVLVTLCLIFKLFEDNHVHLQLILRGYHSKTWLQSARLQPHVTWIFGTKLRVSETAARTLHLSHL